MDQSFTVASAEVLKNFNVTEAGGLSSQQVTASRTKYGSNSLPEDPPTPIWQLILEQFKDQLVLILLGSAAISFVLALLEESDDWTAFVDPVVVGATLSFTSDDDVLTNTSDSDHPHPQRRCRCYTRK